MNEGDLLNKILKETYCHKYLQSLWCTDCREHFAHRGSIQQEPFGHYQEQQNQENLDLNLKVLLPKQVV